MSNTANFSTDQEERTERRRVEAREATARQFLSDELEDALSSARKQSPSAVAVVIVVPAPAVSADPTLLAEATADRLELEETNLRGCYIAQAYGDFRAIKSIEKEERKVLIREAVVPVNFEALAQALFIREENLRGAYSGQEIGNRRSVLSIEKKQRKVLIAEARAAAALPTETAEATQVVEVPEQRTAAPDAAGVQTSSPTAAAKPYLRALGILVGDMTAAERVTFKALSDLADMSFGGSSSSTPMTRTPSVPPTAENLATLKATPEPHKAPMFSPTPRGPLPELQPTPRIEGATPTFTLAASPSPPPNGERTAPRHGGDNRPSSEDPSSLTRPENQPRLRGTTSMGSPDGTSPAAAPIAVDPFFLYLMDDMLHTEVVERNTLLHEEYEDRGNILVDWELEMDELRNDQRWKQMSLVAASAAGVAVAAPPPPASPPAVPEAPPKAPAPILRRPSEEHNPERIHHHHHAAQPPAEQPAAGRVTPKNSNFVVACDRFPSPPQDKQRVVLTLEKLLAAEMYQREEIAKHYRAVYRMCIEGLNAGRFDAPLRNAAASPKRPSGLPAALSPTGDRKPGPPPAVSPPAVTIASTQRLVMGYSGTTNGRLSRSPQLRIGTSSTLGRAGRETTSGMGGALRLDDIAAEVFVPEAHQLGKAQQNPAPSALSAKSSTHSGNGGAKPQQTTQEREMVLRKLLSHCLNDEMIEREMLVHDEVEELYRLEDACKDPIVDLYDWFISGYRQGLRHNRGMLFAPKQKDRHLPSHMRRSVSRLYSPSLPSITPTACASRQDLGAGYSFAPSPPAVLRDVPRDLTQSVAGVLVNKFNDFGNAAPSMPKTLSPQPPVNANTRKRITA